MAYIIIDDPSGYASFYDVPREVYEYIQELKKQIERKTEFATYLEQVFIEEGEQ